MAKASAANTRIKRKYFTFLEDARQMKASSVDQVAAAIAAFERSTGNKDFRQFHIEQARRFKRQMETETQPETGKPLAKATTYARLRHLKAFFQWLSQQSGYRSRLNYADAEYFNPSLGDARIATARRERPVPTLEQIRHVLASIPSDTPVEKRNRALVAFTVLTGARDRAIASLCLKHVDCDRRQVMQDAREVKTKFSKTIYTTFFPVGNDIERMVSDWITYLKQTELFGPNDPLFPKTRVAVSREDRAFKAAGLTRQHWSDAAPIRTVFRQAFAAANLPYANPHSFRNTLAILGEKTCKTPEEMKAWSQNLGHENVLTTFMSYGTVAGHRQAEIINGLANGEADTMSKGTLNDTDISLILRAISDHGLKQ